MQVENMEYLLLHSKLQDCYSRPQANNEFQIYCPSLSQACVSSYDQEWCRVQVIGAFVCTIYQTSKHTRKESQCRFYIQFIKVKRIACVHLSGFPGGRMVEVRYVDFGYRKTLSVKDLRQIKDEFFALPEMVRFRFTCILGYHDGQNFILV